MPRRKATEHPLNFLIVRALGLPPRRAKDPKTGEDSAEYRTYAGEERELRLQVASLRNWFDRLPDEAQAFVAQYLQNGFDPVLAVRDAEILTVDVTEKRPVGRLEYEAKARRIMRDPTVSAIIDAATKLGRLDRPNSPRLRARMLAALDMATSTREVIDAGQMVVKVFGKEVVADPDDTDGLPDLSKLANGVKTGVAHGVVNPRTGVVEK